MLKNIISYIIQGDNVGWTRSVSNTSLQDVSLIAASPAAGTHAQTLIQIIIDVVDDWESSAPIVQKPTYSSGINYKLKNEFMHVADFAVMHRGFEHSYGSKINNAKFGYYELIHPKP